VVTTIDPDSLAGDPDVLRDIVRRFGGKLALNAAVLRGGTIRTGDKVELDTTERSVQTLRVAGQSLSRSAIVNQFN
jgi:MOSC domain-containing protein YiiM